MRKTGINILRQDIYYNLLNNIKWFDEHEKQIEKSIIKSKCNEQDGFIFTEKTCFSFIKTSIDVWFMVDVLFKPIYLYTKHISLTDENGWTKQITYTDNNVSDRN